MVSVLGHLGWEHPGWPAEQDILSLEARLADAVRKLPSIVLCAYDVQRLSGGVRSGKTSITCRRSSF
jgi:hypothetical protein